MPAYFPETSTIAYERLDRSSQNKEYSVQCITLDSFFENHNTLKSALPSSIVVKIDVEGFEENVLNGAINFIQRVKPWFPIDIHTQIKGGETTEKNCRKILSKFGYSFENMGHVLLASPKADQ